MVTLSTEVENQCASFLIIDTKIYVLVETLSNKDNVKLLQQLKSGFKRTTNWNKVNQKQRYKSQTNVVINQLIRVSGKK